MQEMDNCPVCGSTCRLEYGIATCETCKTRWRRRNDQASGKMVYERWACRIPEMTMSIPYIVSNVKFGSKWCKWKTVTSKQLSTTELRGKTEESQIVKKETIEETAAISPKVPAVYDFKLVRGDKVEGRIVADKPVDVWFFDQYNVDKFLANGRYAPEEVCPDIYEKKIEFQARKKGLFYVVISKSQKEPAKVKVNLYSLHRDK